VTNLSPQTRTQTEHSRAFTLIELMVVIAVILILAGLVLSISGYAMDKGKRSRAETEIAAMSAAMESYKADNGIYPAHSVSTGQAHALYQALTGDGNDAIGGSTASTGTPGSSNRSYMSLKPAMVTPNPPGNSARVVDAWRYDYGYLSPGTNNPTFDLWSTGTPNGSSQNTDQTKFIKNW
jgi:prepilin-type N-terminal cleavage/methylation domain-containing protein